MCGGGGSSIGDYPSPSRVSEIAGRIGSSIDQGAYANDLNNRLAAALQDANARDTGQLNIHLDTIQRTLENDLGESIQLRYGGSLRRHTSVDGISDADLLVILRAETALDASPKALIDQFAQALHSRLPDTEISTGSLSVKVRFADGTEIQLLPAFRTSTGLRIARPRGDTWSGVIQPDLFARELTALNQRMSGNVVRAIKLYKIAQSSLPDQDQLDGYHIEAIALGAFESYTGPFQYKDVFLHLARQASVAVLNRMPETTGQSAYVDSDLGAPGSPERTRVSKSIQRMVRRLELAGSQGSIEAWEEQFGPW